LCKKARALTKKPENNSEPKKADENQTKLCQFLRHTQAHKERKIPNMARFCNKLRVKGDKRKAKTKVRFKK
jgi:hypothetical protein